MRKQYKLSKIKKKKLQFFFFDGGSVKTLCSLLTLSQTTNFTRFQTERACRRQFQI